MSEQDEFEYFNDNYPFPPKAFRDCAYTYGEMEICWRVAREQQAAEIAALRGFAEFVLAKSKEGLLIGAELNWILLCGETHNLIDENGNPTKILTGESK